MKYFYQYRIDFLFNSARFAQHTSRTKTGQENRQTRSEGAWPRERRGHGRAVPSGGVASPVWAGPLQTGAAHLKEAEPWGGARE